MDHTLEPDEISILARRISEQVAPLCAHVPTADVERLAARLAWLELASRAPEDPESEEAPLAGVTGNQVVWLPGSVGMAIVLPASDFSEARGLASSARISALSRQYMDAARALYDRVVAALLQLWNARLNLDQTRPDAGSSDR